MDYLNCDSGNFFKKIRNFKNHRKNFLHLEILDEKDIDKIVNKLLEFDKIKIKLGFGFVENIPECIFQLVNICELTLGSDKYIPNNICKLVNLQKLYASASNFNKSIYFSSLKKLTILDIQNVFKKYELYSPMCIPLSIKVLIINDIKISTLIKLKNINYIDTYILIFDKNPIVLCDLQHLNTVYVNDEKFNIIKIQEKRLIYRLSILIFLKKLKLFNYKIISKLIKY